MKSASETVLPSKAKGRQIHPMVGWVLAAIIAGSVLAFRNSRSSIVTHDQAVALIDPQIRKAGMDPGLDAKYRQTRLLLEPLEERDEVDLSYLGALAPTAKAIMPRLYGDNIGLDEMTALLSGDFEPLGNQSGFWAQESMIIRARLQSKTTEFIRQGDRQQAISMAKASVALQPLLFQAQRMSFTDAKQTLEQLGSSKAMDLSLAHSSGLVPKELQEVLNSYALLPTHSALAHDALARSLSDDLLPLILDPEKRYPIVAMLSIPENLPVDERGTVETASNLYLTIDKNLQSDFAHRDQTPERELADLGKELDPVLQGDAYESQGTLDRIGTKVRMWLHPNAIGKYLLYKKLPDLLTFQMDVFRFKTAYEAARLNLALDIYKAQHGYAAPAKLEDLITQKILSSVPIDPFSGKQFCYSPTQGIIYSVGEDGVDEGGSPKLDIVF